MRTHFNASFYSIKRQLIVPTVIIIFLFYTYAHAATPPENWLCVKTNEDYGVSIYINPARNDGNTIFLDFGGADVVGTEYIFFDTEEARQLFLSGIPNVGTLIANKEDCTCISTLVDYYFDKDNKKLYKRFNSIVFYDDSGNTIGSLDLEALGLNEWGGVKEGLISWQAFFNERSFLMSRSAKEKEVETIKHTPSRWNELTGEYREDMIKRCEMSWSGKSKNLKSIGSLEKNGIKHNVFLDISSIKQTNNGIYRCWVQDVFDPEFKVDDSLCAKDYRMYMRVNYNEKTVSLLFLEINPVSGKGHWVKEFMYVKNKLGESELFDLVYKNLRNPQYQRTGLQQ